jgi:hypothetical protein
VVGVAPAARCCRLDGAVRSLIITRSGEAAVLGVSMTAKGRAWHGPTSPKPLMGRPSPRRYRSSQAIERCSGGGWSACRRGIHRRWPPTTIATVGPSRTWLRGATVIPSRSLPSHGIGLASPDTGGAEKPDRRPLTDAERVQTIREELSWARREGLATDKRYLDDDGIWSAERQDAHDAIVNDIYNVAAGVPCEREAIMAGGLGGAGKSTVLDGYANVDRSKYLTINPDDIKEQMAKCGLIPDLNGLSPMEASDLRPRASSCTSTST